MERVRSTGSSKALRKSLFPNGFAGEVMRLISESWQVFKLPMKVGLEEPITALFADLLVKEYERLGLPWYIFPEIPITDKVTGEQEGRTDLNFFHRNVPGQSKFFTVECKRLHVSPPSGFKSLVGEYFKEGLQRFVTERYSVAHSCGGMLGYVLDNDVETAFKHINKKFLSEPPELLLRPDYGWRSPSGVMPHEKFSGDSAHLRKISGDLIIHHLLVGIPRGSTRKSP